MHGASAHQKANKSAAEYRDEDDELDIFRGQDAAGKRRRDKQASQRRNKVQEEDMYEQELANLDRTAFVDGSVDIHDRTAEVEMDALNDSEPDANGKRQGINKRAPMAVRLSDEPPEPAGKARRGAHANRDPGKAEHGTQRMPKQKYGKGRRQIS